MAIGWAARRCILSECHLCHDGLTLWYEESGPGDPVIFIAGTMSDHTTVGHRRPATYSELRSITSRQSRHRQQQRGPARLHVRDMAGDMLALMGHLNLERPAS